MRSRSGPTAEKTAHGARGRVTVFDPLDFFPDLCTRGAPVQRRYRCDSSRRCSMRSSTSARVVPCRRSVPKRSTANEPMALP